MKTDKRVDAYIAGQPDFARPILAHLRDMLHEACPECEETMKWSRPSFLYKGKILAGFSAFKAHAAFGYWNDSMLSQEEKNRSAMGQFGRLTSLADLPPRATLVELTDHGAGVLEAIGAARGTEAERVFSRLSPADRADLGRILRELIRARREQGDADPR